MGKLRVKEQNLKKRYIKDYVSDEKGEVKYQGKYYFSALGEAEGKKEGMTQIIFSSLSLLLILMALSISCSGNRTVYIVIPLELTLFCFWVQLTGSVKLLKVETKLEQKDYDKVYQSPIQALTIAIILEIFSFGGQMIGIFMDISKRSKGDIYFSMILFGILVVTCVAWNRRRKLMRFVTEETFKK